MAVSSSTHVTDMKINMKTDYEQQITTIVEGVAQGNEHDTLDMQRLGKVQQFKRSFNFLSTLGFISIYMSTWEYTFISLAVSLVNGGFAGLFWTFIGVVVCYSSVVLSLAEMTSMAPTSGGQYHWVSEFAPVEHQRCLSYCAGWMSTLGWVASVASSTFICATMIQSIVDAVNTSFAFPNWQYTLIMLAFLFVTILFNTWGAKSLPTLEIISLIGHLGCFLVFIVPIWVLAPRNSASEVFTSFVDGGGWGNMGLACLISQTSVLYCNLGSDSIVHISEEVENASWTVPRVMWWSYILNTVLAIIALVTMLFCIGTLDQAVSTDVPYLQLFLNTGSETLALTLLVLLFILICAGNITALATASREVFAFARDKGFPFSGWLSRIDHRRHIPFNAVYITSIFAGILCLINLGSTFAFNITISLNLIALVSTYMLSIGCVMLKRLKGEQLPPARWSLGRLGLPINILAFLYSAFSVIFACFPASQPVDLSTANWAPVVWVGVMVLSILVYFVHGKKHYTAPIDFVEGKRTGGFQEAG